MKAMVLHGMGQPLRLEEVPVPKTGPDDVLIRVRVCGVGLTVVKNVAIAGVVTSYPRIPGHEIAGEVVEIGSEVKTVHIGQRVTCHFHLTCGQCVNCRSGRETMCLRHRGVIGNVCDGGYAEYVALPERNIIPIPDGVSDLAAAIAADAIVTPYHACHKEARVSPGDNVLIIGAGGGVGVHMVQMARLCGGRVLAADIGGAKLALATDAGADEVIDVRRGELAKQVKALTDVRGADAVIDIVGSQETLEAGLASLAVGGRLVIIGIRPPAIYDQDPSFRVDPVDFLQRGLEIHASRYGNAAELAQTLELLRRGRIKAMVTQTFPLAGAEEVHELIRKNAVGGRIALVMS